MSRPEVTGKKTGRRLLDYQALRERGIPWTRIHIARLEAAKEFPLHIDIGKNSRAWFEDEIDDFLEVKAAERDAKAAERAAKATECVPVDDTQDTPTGRRPHHRTPNVVTLLRCQNAPESGSTGTEDTDRPWPPTEKEPRNDGYPKYT